MIKPLIRESFERYELGLFPHKGGWQRVREEPQRARQRTGRAQEGKEGRLAQDSQDKEWEIGKAFVDGGEYCSGSRSFRLDNSGGMPVSVVKRFSLPDRIPFDVSEDCFAIVLTEGLSQTTETEFDASGRELGERNGGGRGKRELDRSSGRRERAGERKRSSGEETAPDASSNLAGARTEGNIRTLSASGGGSYYIYSFNGMLLAEYDINGNCVRDYIYLCGQLVAEFRSQGGQYYYYTSDQINSTRIVTNNSGTVVYSAAYDPYGGIQKTWTSTYTPTLKFSGKERDGESNLDYFGARYYDKSQYRFISVDPITARTAALFDTQLWNLYSYCRNSPVTFFDPEGKQPICIRVVRDYYGDHMTLGTIYADGIRFGTTQELPWMFNAEDIACIELGIYAAWVALSPRKGYNVIWLEDENGRRKVQIHALGKKLEGCIGMVGRSNFDILMAYIALRQASYVSTVLAGVEVDFPPILFVSVENDTLRPVVSTNYFLGTYSDLLMLIWYVWTFLR